MFPAGTEPGQTPESAQDACERAAQYIEAAAAGDSRQLYQAVLCYEQAIKAAPALIEPYLALAWIWLQLEQADKAAPFVRQALDIEPFNSQAQSLWKAIASALR